MPCSSSAGAHAVHLHPGCQLDRVSATGLVPALHGANADLNATAAMAAVVIVVVEWYSVRVLGWRGFLRRFTKPFELPLPARIAFIPLNIIEEVTSRSRFRSGCSETSRRRRDHRLIVGLGTLSLPVGARSTHDRGQRPSGCLEDLRRALHRLHSGIHLHAVTVVYFGMAARVSSRNITRRETQ